MRQPAAMQVTKKPLVIYVFQRCFSFSIQNDHAILNRTSDLPQGGDPFRGRILWLKLARNENFWRENEDRLISGLASKVCKTYYLSDAWIIKMGHCCPRTMTAANVTWYQKSKTPSAASLSSKLSCETSSVLFSPASSLIVVNSINLTFILFVFNTPSLSDPISLLGKTTGSTTHLRIVSSRKLKLLRNRDALCTFKGRHLLRAVLRGRLQVTAEGMRC